MTIVLRSLTGTVVTRRRHPLRGFVAVQEVPVTCNPQCNLRGSGGVTTCVRVVLAVLVDKLCVSINAVQSGSVSTRRGEIV